MDAERKATIVEGVTQKRWYHSTTFLATLLVELGLLAGFYLVLFFELEPELSQKVLSALVLAITFVAVAFIAPKIAHDAVTRIPAVKGLFGGEAPGEEKPPEA